LKVLKDLHDSNPAYQTEVVQTPHFLSTVVADLALLTNSDPTLLAAYAASDTTNLEKADHLRILAPGLNEVCNCLGHSIFGVYWERNVKDLNVPALEVCVAHNFPAAVLRVVLGLVVKVTVGPTVQKEPEKGSSPSAFLGASSCAAPPLPASSSPSAASLPPQIRSVPLSGVAFLAETLMFLYPIGVRQADTALEKEVFAVAERILDTILAVVERKEEHEKVDRELYYLCGILFELIRVCGTSGVTHMQNPQRVHTMMTLMRNTGGYYYLRQISVPLVLHIATGMAPNVAAAEGVTDFLKAEEKRRKDIEMADVVHAWEVAGAFGFQGYEY
jgi:hypothetical protein